MLKIRIERVTSGRNIVLKLDMGQTYLLKGSCHNNSVIFILSNSVTFNKFSSVWYTYNFIFCVKPYNAIYYVYTGCI